MEFTVTWTIQINALTPRKAAEEALKIQRDAFSTATLFEVFDEEGDKTTIDLEEVEES